MTLHNLHNFTIDPESVVSFFYSWCNSNKSFIEKIYDTDFLFEKTFDLNSFLNLPFKNNKKIFQRMNILDKLFEIFNARNNFDRFLLNSEEYKDPQILMDIFKQPGILHPDGCNLVIFNSNNKSNLTITCPLWDRSELLDKSYKSKRSFLLKYLYL